MEKLFATRIAGENGPHRLRHVVMTINYVDESDARLSILMSTRYNPVPKIRSEDHSRPRRFFNPAAREAGCEKRGAIAESHSRSIRRAIDHVFSITHRIVNRLVPRLTVA